MFVLAGVRGIRRHPHRPCERTQAHRRGAGADQGDPSAVVEQGTAMNWTSEQAKAYMQRRLKDEARARERMQKLAFKKPKEDQKSVPSDTDSIESSGHEN